MEARTVKSTSKQSAVTDDIVLRQTHTTRLVFRPMLVANEREKAAAVKGFFVFQRKSASDQWGDTESIPFSSLKKDEGYRLELKSSELLKFVTELRTLYELHSQEGIPRGETRFIRANETIQALVDMTDDDLRAVVEGSRTLGAQALSRLLRWAGDARNLALMLQRLEPLEPDSLITLNAAVGIASLKRALKTWSDNRNNGKEEFWHQLIRTQSFVLEQVFAVARVVIQSKAYVGGKTTENRGGHIADFIVKNWITNAVGLVEIKTPMTPLLGSEYRSGIHNVSEELSGAIMQVLHYRDSLGREWATLLDRQSDAFDPKCLVLIGHARKELTDTDKRRSFELFRRQLPDVEIVTYDEMFERTKRLINILEGRLENDDVS